MEVDGECVLWRAGGRAGVTRTNKTADNYPDAVDTRDTAGDTALSRAV